jgi:YesN/AraC family two-component response regulator
MDDDRDRATQYGADEFLSKPCNEHDLLEKLRLLLNITYDYDEADNADGQRLAVPEPLSAERLGHLPLKLIEELRNATVAGNKKLLDRLILQVRESEDDGSWQALQALADKYEYDALTRLLEEACRR